jgi:tRNA (cmo5U34)-methyltransferase
MFNNDESLDKYKLPDKMKLHGAPRLAKNEYRTAEHALAYLAKADGIPHRAEGEAVLLSFVPCTSKRILDLGTGDGRLLALLRSHCPDATLVGLDFSPTMIDAASARFCNDPCIEIRNHDLNTTLPAERYDVVVSSFAIHHCTHSRKRSLYSEIYELLEPGGIFCNLEHVSSPTDVLHAKFLSDMGSSPDEEDRSNILLDVQTQIQWLSETGFANVDCYWKWLELALFGGARAGQRSG